MPRLGLLDDSPDRWSKFYAKIKGASFMSLVFMRTPAVSRLTNCLPMQSFSTMLPRACGTRYSMSRGTVRGITTLPRANMEPRSVDGRRQVALSLICTISLICQSFRPLGLGRGLLEALRKLLASAPCMLSHDLSWCTPPQTDGNTTWGPDPALTLLGQEQALNVAAEWALEIPNGARLPDVIWSSPLRRAAHTLALTYEKTAIAQGVRPMFKEVSLRLMSHRSLASPEE